MTLNQKHSKTGPVWAGYRAFSIAASRQDTGIMGIQTERYKQRPRTGAIRHGALILKAKIKWVNSPVRRPTHVSRANQPLLKHKTTMPKPRPNFKQTFV